MSREICLFRSIFQVPNAIQRINRYPADSVVSFVDTYPLDSDLSGGYRYPPFEQPGPGVITVSTRQLMHAGLFIYYSVDHVWELLWLSLINVMTFFNVS